jgi:hypothetical protein
VGLLAESAKGPGGDWLELAVECDTEAVEPVSELFARFGFNEGVVVEEPFTQEPDGDNLAVDRSRPGHGPNLPRRRGYPAGDS